jgi:2-oxoglutarate ferredoxin oxidoreductase subunit beta
MTQTLEKLRKKDFESDQDVKWCPGCGDYMILAQVQKVFPELGIPKEQFLVVSGIGCSSRFPYYMNTYGFHSIHGRAPAIASGAKVANPDLNVWLVTGDGDAMSIGGNHFIHLLRRNLDINVLLFNNRIYGLTKGQYSPTSEENKVTYSTPSGSVDFPFNPSSLALGAGSTFIARTIDRESKHLQSTIKMAQDHIGTSFVEVYQNCNIFNDGAFSELTDKEIKAETQLILDNDKPMIFGKEMNKGIRLDGLKPEVVEIGKKFTIDDLIVHDESDKVLSMMLSELTYDNKFPTPLGVLYKENKPTYEELLMKKIDHAVKNRKGSLQDVITGTNTWEVI